MNLKFWREQLQLANTWTIARGSTNVFEVVMVELTAPDGLGGIGEASPIGRYHESPATVENFFRRVDASQLSFDNLTGSMSYLETLSSTDMAAKCALNIALIDGAARRSGKAVYDFLGLGFRENHHMTSFSIGIAELDVIRKKVHAADRFSVLKLKVGVPNDQALLAALREAAPTKAIRLDATEGWKASIGTTRATR